MRVSTLVRLFVALFLPSVILGSATVTSAQVPVDAVQTLPPFGGFTGSDFDIVALQNGNLHMSIPLVDVSQRGGKTIWFKFVYDTPTYTLTFFPPPPPPQTGKARWTVSRASQFTGWRVTNSLNWSDTFTSVGIKCASGSDVVQTYNMRDPDGVLHPFGVATTGGVCSPGAPSAPALDASGLFLDLSSGGKGLILKDGSTIKEDTNGNIFGGGTCNPISCPDTLNRLLLVQTAGSTVNFTTPLGQTVSGPQYLLLTYTDSNGAPQDFRVDYEALDLSTGICGSLSNCTDANHTTIVPSRVTLPTGAYYQFTWVNDSQAQLQQVQLPTGGTISYTYASVCTYTGVEGNSPELCRMEIKSRKVTVGGSSSQWTYTGGTWDSNGDPYATVTDPYGNAEVHQFTFMNPGSSVETKVISYSGPMGGTVLKTVATSYKSEGLGSGGTQVNVRPIQQTITLDNGQTRMTQTDYDTFQANICALSGSTLACFAQTVSRMDATAVREYDYGGSLLRTTDYAYLHVSNTAYAAANIVDRVTTKTVLNGGGTQVAKTTYEYDNYGHAGQPLLPSGAVQHDPTFSTSYALRGNITAVSLWRNTDGALLTTTNQYDDAGNVLSSVDPLGNKSGFSYTDMWANTACVPSGGNAAAYLTTTKNALGQPTSHSYNSCTGLLATTKDPNLQTTSFTYDGIGRVTVISYPDGGQTSNSYNDTQIPPTETTKKKINSTQNYAITNVFDGLGRVSQSQVTSDSPSTTYFVTLYDALGRKGTVYNPTRCSPPTTNCGESTWGYTTYTYDALGRAKLVTNPDTSTVQTSYIGRATEVTDEGNGTKSVQRISQTDALGRLNSVCEVSSTALSVGASPAPAACGQDIGGTGFLTSYQYDILGNLKGVSQAGLSPRSFFYDSLSRLTSASNPESGSTCYGTVSAGACQNNGYDANGNVVRKTDARGITTTYTYDALNRLTQKSYSDGTPTANFFYDANVWHNINLTNTVGRLSYDGALSGSTYLASEAFSYDSMGRVINNSQCTIPGCPNGPYSVTYGYDLLGDMTSTSPGAPVTLTYGYNSAAQLTSMTSSLVDANHPSSLLSGVLYNPAGSLASAFMGTYTSTSGIYESRTYNNRLRTTVISTGVNTPTGFVGLVGMTYGYAPNGDVTSLADGPTGNWTFTYDDFNRLQSTVVPNYPSSPYAYVYDRYGNRWKQTANSTCTAGTAFCISFDANNRVTGGILTYDAAGNVIADNMHHYTYDAENRLTQVDAGTTASYVYDASGRRMQKTTAGTTVNYIYDLNGHVVTEYSSTGEWNRGEMYAGSRHLATYRNSLTYFSSVDALGSERARSTQNESSVEGCDSLPFGDDQYCYASAAGNVSPLHFTGQERDSESGLDNFTARYNSSNIGRFISPDPSNLSIDFWLPQTWNRYSYALNNPLKFVDRNGLWPTNIHNEIIYEAFPGLSSNQIQTLEKASYDTDYNNPVNGYDPQDPAVSFVHGMSDGLTNQDPMQAQQQGDDFIAQNEHDAQQIQADWIAAGNSGIAPAALTAFGNALHTIEDRLSPSHAGNQPWYGTHGLKNRLRALRHVQRESVITPSQRIAAIAAARVAFIQTFGIQIAMMENETQLACVTTQGPRGSITTCE
jgi:RHS repeat-associated protein